ncbi:DUF502 domain-containing protein [Halolamina sp.]|jgi:uncharacterized membrane protein|uniref:DUF502 domain-containing protein n=1 Tax=Halolamina sp. TaxID=1940283 RepID=UPI000223B4DF|nr:protein of unknown function DUF502 [halophilic archaeon DL31]
MTRWKRDFASGLVVVLPVLVLALVLQWAIRKLLSLPPAVNAQWLSAFQAQVAEVVVTIALFAALTLAAGYLMRTTAGRVVERMFDDVINQMPGFRVVYNASKLAVETAVSGTDDLQKPVKLEPWQGMRMTAFKTGKSTEDGRDVVFMPTAPNITTGFVMEVEPADYVETDEQVEEALTRILSAGFGESEKEGIPINVVDEAATDDRDR